MKYIIVLAGAVFAGLFPATAAAEDYTSCPNAICGLESNWGPGGYFGRRLGLDNVQQCLEFCNLPRKWGTCESFTFSDTGTCWIHTLPAKDGSSADPGSGNRVWDKECEACGAIPSPTTTAPASTPTNCLSKTSVCEVEAKWKGGEDLESYGRGEGIDYPFACWELCTDERRASRCKSFTWEPSTQVCLLYDQSAEITHVAEEGSGVWLWDLDCWTCGVSGYT